MFKKNFLFLSLFLLSNCSTPTTALLGPIFTGAKTGSVYQASISYSSNILISEIREFEKKKSTNKKIIDNSDISTFARTPLVIASYQVNDVEFSEIFDEEPLP
tara:strand:- start:470 stop:778 length:309 start_codon:yes stop_codon:yes gene_type:complete